MLDGHWSRRVFFAREIWFGNGILFLLERICLSILFGLCIFVLGLIVFVVIVPFTLLVFFVLLFGF